MRCTIPEPVTG
uniref:Uncharacterized protein n=1 Tax=Arundo donax TaxID=35708 RepID=A0A0A9GR30_ARUDO